jgi:Skp family chaperone for outer membrane proteins
MKNWLRRYIPILLLLSVASGPAMAQGKIATVDMKKIFDRYWKKKAAEDRLKDQQAGMEKEEKNMKEEFNQLKEEYNTLNNSTGDSNISPEERDKRKKLADDKMKKMKDLDDAFKQYDASAKTRLMEQGQRLKSQIVDEIRNQATAKAKAQGFALVLDTAAVSGDGIPIILFSNNENDITDAVLVELNRGAQTDPSKAEDKPANKKEESKKTGK